MSDATCVLKSEHQVGAGGVGGDRGHQPAHPRCHVTWGTGEPGGPLLAFREEGGVRSHWWLKVGFSLAQDAPSAPARPSLPHTGCAPAGLRALETQGRGAVSIHPVQKILNIHRVLGTMSFRFGDYGDERHSAGPCPRSDYRATGREIHKRDTKCRGRYERGC